MSDFCGFFPGRMACFIINVLVLNSQQGDNADRSPSRTNTPENEESGALWKSCNQSVRKTLVSGLTKWAGHG